MKDPKDVAARAQRLEDERDYEASVSEHDDLMAELEQLRALVGRKRKKKRDPLDRYYTPDPVALACVDALRREAWMPASASVLEPSCGGGAFLRALKAAGVRDVVAMDVDPDAAGLTLVSSMVGDFLTAEVPMTDERPDWIIGNPPYTNVEAHILRALEVARVGVAMLLRVSTLEGVDRYRRVWSQHQPAYVWHLVRRPYFSGPTVVGKQTDNATYIFVVWHKEWAEDYAESRWLEVGR